MFPRRNSHPLGEVGLLFNSNVTKCGSNDQTSRFLLSNYNGGASSVVSLLNILFSAGMCRSQDFHSKCILRASYVP